MKSARLKFILRALESPNYRLFFGGQIVSLVGTWLTTVATSWLVYRLAKASGNSTEQAALALGTVGFASQIPQLFLLPFAGVWVDRLDRHWVLVGTQFLSMLQSFALAFLALKGLITIPWIIGLNLFQGAINALDMPARQSLTVDLVERREDLSNAIALSSSMVHSARLVGPAIAGFLIYRFGEGSCFLIDGFSYLAVLVSLLRMHLRPREKLKKHPPVWESLREGFTHAFGFAPLRALLVLTAATSLFTMAQQVLMPIVANDILEGGERVYGFLLCASGAGALAATLYLASRKSVVGLGRVIARSNLALGLGLMAFAASRTLPLSLGLLFIVGGAMVLQIAAANTVIQTIVEDRMRGRVLSFFSVSFMGVMPLGSLWAGFIARRIGTSWTLGLAGLGCLLCSIFFWRSLPRLREVVHPIYIRLGLLQEAVR